MQKRLIASILCAHTLVGIASPPAFAQGALSGWLPIENVDKAFNDASMDLNRVQRFALSDCANFRDRFACSYISTTGSGMVAAGAAGSNLADVLTIAIPPCNVIAELTDISTMLIHIFHPRRPYETFSRSIVAMTRTAQANGQAEHWLDTFSYVLVDRAKRGVGLVVRRSDRVARDGVRPARPPGARSHAEFFLPRAACPLPPPPPS